MNNIYDYAEKALKRIAVRGSLIVAKMNIDSKLDPEVVIFDNQDFLKVMNVSKMAIQQWRESSYIYFSQYYYCLSGAKVLLNTNYNPKK